MDFETLQKASETRKRAAARAAVRLAMSPEVRQTVIEERAAELAELHAAITEKLELICQAVFGDTQEGEKDIFLGYGGGSEYTAKLERHPGRPMAVHFVTKEGSRTYRPVPTERFEERFEDPDRAGTAIFHDGKFSWESLTGIPESMEGALDYAEEALNANADTTELLLGSISTRVFNPEASMRLAELRALQQA